MRRKRRQRRHAERQVRRWLEVNDRAHASKTACRGSWSPRKVSAKLRSRGCAWFIYERSKGREPPTTKGYK